MEKMKMQTTDVANENFLKLAALFPHAVTETIDENGDVVRAIDKDILMQEISTRVVEGNEERYQFTWPDKRQAMRLASTPIAATLRPCREESVNFDTTQNLYIEGDNLDVLKLLRETYLGKVKMIYIDPPYNTGNDFVYEDDFAEDAGEFQFRDNQYDAQGNRLVQNTESNGRFHTDWLNMIYPRLKVAKDLLADDGVIFISIDDNEIENCQKICNDLFGKNNHIATFIVIRSEGGGLAKQAIIGHDYLLIYAKSILTFPPLGKPKDIRGKIVVKNGEEYWIETDWFREVFGQYGTCHYEDILTFYNQTKKDEIDAGLKRGDYILIEKNGKHIVGRYRKVADDTTKFYTILKHLNKNGVADLESLGMAQYFDYPKPVSLLKEIIQGATIRSKEEKNIILDFFSGSATTAHAVMAQNIADGGNRKFIMVQYPEDLDEKLQKVTGNARKTVESAIELCNSQGTAHYLTEVGKERIRRAGKKIKEEAGLTAADLDIGFRVLKLDSSNMEDVYYAPDKTSQDDLLSLISNIKPDRTPEDLLFQVMLEFGITLDSKIEETVISGKKVFKVAGNFLIACFDDNVTDDVVKAIAQATPAYAVLRDSSFANDSVAANFEQIFATYSPDTVRRVL